MRNMILRGSLSFAISCVTAGVLFAQQPQPTNPQTPTDPQPPATATQRGDDDRDRMVTATGCLKQEKDVPGARPNVAERAGVTEDFILTQAKLTKGTAGARASGRTGAMYKISGLDDEKLRSHSNQQVEVQGRLNDRTAITGTTKPTTPGPDTAPDEVQEIRATSIKMLASTCSAGTN
jgi:hypothetical protein